MMFAHQLSADINAMKPSAETRPILEVKRDISKIKEDISIIKMNIQQILLLLNKPKIDYDVKEDPIQEGWRLW